MYKEDKLVGQYLWTLKDMRSHHIIAWNSTGCVPIAYNSLAVFAIIKRVELDSYGHDTFRHAEIYVNDKQYTRKAARKLTFFSAAIKDLNNKDIQVLKVLPPSAAFCWDRFERCLKILGYYIFLR